MTRASPPKPTLAEHIALSAPLTQLAHAMWLDEEDPDPRHVEFYGYSQWVFMPPEELSPLMADARRLWEQTR